MSTLLSCDTCNASCSVALTQDGKLLAYREDTRPSKQAEILVPLIEEVLNEAQVTYKELNALAVSIGPGSFTGVRIGLATMRGIKLVNNIPLYGITTLEALATYQQELPGMVCFDAKRDQICIQSFNTNNQPVTEPQLLSIQEVNAILMLEKKVTLIGNGVALLNEKNVTKHHTIVEPQLPTAKEVAQVAQSRIEVAGMPESIPEPFYVRPPDAKKQEL